MPSNSNDATIGTPSGVPSRTKGRKQSEATKQKISETKRKKNAERRANQVDPPLKRCTICKEYKRRWADFYAKKKRLKDGTVIFYPSPECRPCQRKRLAEYRKNMTPEQKAAQYKKVNAHRRRQYAERKKNKRGEMVDVWDFLHWLTEEKFERLRPSTQRSLHRACNEQQGRVSLPIIDKALVELDEVEMLDMLYKFKF